MDIAVKPTHQTYGTTPRSPAESRKIRIWAKEHGVQVNARGRLPYHVIEAYENRENE